MVNTGSHFVACVRIESKLPHLVLEEIEHHLFSVLCFKSRIELQFTTKETATAAAARLGAHHQFLIITSHLDCNKEGERETYLVYDVFFKKEESAVILSVNHLPWKKAFHTLTVDFNINGEEYLMRRHDDVVYRRQSPSSSTGSSASPTFAENLIASSAIVFPTASTTPSATAVTVALNHQLTNASVTLDLAGNAGTGADVNVPVAISCRNCTTSGSIELSHGSFTVNNPNNTSNDTFLDQFFASGFAAFGYVEFLVCNFTAHVELETSIPTSGTTAWSASLGTFPLTPFTIPGIAAVGPMFDHAIAGTVTLNAAVNFTYGFDLSVPPNSSVRLNIANITNSSLNGFSHTSLSTTPFQATTPALTLLTTLTYRPRLLLGLTLFDFPASSASAACALALSLPALAANISQLPASAVNSTCDPRTPDAGNPPAGGDLTLIAASAVVDVELVALATVAAADVRQGVQAAVTLGREGWPLPTRCLSFDAAKGGYGPASVSTTTEPGASTAAGGGAPPKKGAGLEVVRRGAGGAWALLLGLGFLFL